jgi:hypothetical protein
MSILLAHAHELMTASSLHNPLTPHSPSGSLNPLAFATLRCATHAECSKAGFGPMPWRLEIAADSALTSAPTPDQSRAQQRARGADAHAASACL